MDKTPVLGRVLIVDDQSDIRLMCRVNLQLAGYDVTEAANGSEGLRLAFAERPDLVLLDVMMPGMDGWQVLEAIKAEETTATIPVVLLTARVQREDEIKGWEGGAAEYLAKPFNPSAMIAVVHRVLNEEDDGSRREQALQKLSII